MTFHLFTQGRHEDQWTKPESFKVNHYKQFSTRMSRPFTAGKTRIFNQWPWDNQISTSKNKELDPYLTPHIKIIQNGL